MTTLTPFASLATGALAPCRSPRCGLALPEREMRAPIANDARGVTVVIDQVVR